MSETSSFKCGVQAPVYISITEPVNPKANYLWFNPITQALKVRQGTVWELVSTSATPIPSPTKVSVSPPVATEEGELWFDPVTGILSVWYTDLDGGQWLATVPYALLEAAQQAAASAEEAAASAILAEEYAQEAADNAPVQSVAGKIGDVTLEVSDISGATSIGLAAGLAIALG